MIGKTLDKIGPGWTVALMIIGGFIAIGLTLFLHEYLAPKRESTGTVIMQTQTADKYGTPSYYLYIRDDSSGIVIQEEVSGGLFAYCNKGRKLQYEVHYTSDIHYIKLLY